MAESIEPIGLAKDCITQILSLSTAVVALSVTFSKDVAVRSSMTTRWCLFASWATQLLATIAGVAALQCLAGNAAHGVTNIYQPNVTRCAVTQDVWFLIGILLLVIHAILCTLERSASTPSVTPPRGTEQSRENSRDNDATLADESTHG